MKMEKKMKKVVLAAALAAFFGVMPALAAGSFTCWYTPAPVQKLILSAFDPDGTWNIVRRSAGSLVLANEVDPSSVRYLMPRIRLPKRDPRDPREPERWDYAPVFRAEEYVTFNFREARDGQMRVTVRHDVVANPGMRGEVTVKSDCDDHVRLMRYCSTFLNGGYGAGFDTGYRHSHMYITDVFEGSAADRAGVREGDRVRLINKTVADEVSLDQFARKYQWAELGKPFTMDLERPNGERYHVELAVDYIPAQTERCKRFFGLSDADPGISREEVYASAPRYTPPMTPELRKQLAARQSIGMTFDDDGRVTEVVKGALADQAGVKVGDIVAEHNLVALRQLGAAKTRENIEKRVGSGLVSMLTIRRGGKELIVKLRKAQ